MTPLEKMTVTAALYYQAYDNAYPDVGMPFNDDDGAVTRVLEHAGIDECAIDRELVVKAMFERKNP